MPDANHIPVLLKESVEALAIQPGGRYVDCTLGAGGHAASILKQSAPGGQLLGIEADPAAVKSANARLRRFDGSVLIVNDNFVNLEAICREHEFVPVNGVLFDLGLSSLQLGEEGRGFSFQHDAPLDMRFNPTQSLSAADIVNSYAEADLARLIFEFGEEEKSRQIARLIVRARPLHTTAELAQLIAGVAPGYHRIHPATKTFQALRIAVNEELAHLTSALSQAVDILGCEGRLAVISYHSLEDRIVKNFFRAEAQGCVCPPELPQCVCRHEARLRLITKGVVTPSLAEIEANPRARSAKLRVAERLPSATPARRNEGGCKVATSELKAARTARGQPKMRHMANLN
jgi:16S rRNA (cytosine1402-N4)-methyltransferase